MSDWTSFLNPTTPEGRFLLWGEVKAITGLSRTTAWRMQKAGDFPKPYAISPGRVAYREREIDAWRASRTHASSGTAARGRKVFTPPDVESPAPVPSARGVVGARVTAPPPRIVRRRPTARNKPDSGGSEQITFDF